MLDSFLISYLLGPPFQWAPRRALWPRHAWPPSYCKCSVEKSVSSVSVLAAVLQKRWGLSSGWHDCPVHQPGWAKAESRCGCGFSDFRALTWCLTVCFAWFCRHPFLFCFLQDVAILSLFLILTISRTLGDSAKGFSHIPQYSPEDGLSKTIEPWILLWTRHRGCPQAPPLSPPSLTFPTLHDFFFK